MPYRIMLPWYAHLAQGTPLDTSLITQILQSAGAGTAIMLILLLTGIVQPRGYTQRLEKEADDWHTAYDAERQARSDVEKGLAAERQRADAAVETAKIASEVLEELRGRIYVPEAQKGTRYVAGSSGSSGQRGRSSERGKGSPNPGG